MYLDKTLRKNKTVEIGHLQGLETLVLSKNNIVELPNDIIRLSNLKNLDLYQNRKFKKLPDNIGRLENLEYMGIDGCKVREIHNLLDFLRILLD